MRNYQNESFVNITEGLSRTEASSFKKKSYILLCDYYDLMHA